MYEVLIADDEQIIRRGLTRFVEQNAAFHVAAQAEDGDMALELAKQKRFDLAFIDINMPFLNGLDLVEKLRQLQPEAMVVIVSGYDDFEFVQRALQLGAVDYILKPVMEKPFFELMERLKEKLDKNTYNGRYVNWAREQLERNHSALVDDLFIKWLDGRLNVTEFCDDAEYLNIRIPERYVISVVRLREEWKPQMGGSAEPGEDLLYYACQNIAEEIFNSYARSFCFRYHESLVVISEMIEESVWMSLIQQIEVPMKKYFSVNVETEMNVGIGLENFPAVFERTESALRRKGHYSSIVQSAISYAEAHYNDSKLSVQGIAERLHISQQYLSRCFRQETGGAFSAYLANLRIRKAMELLYDPKISIYEVAVQTGYTSQHYFSNSFKKAVGMTPTEYQKSLTGVRG